MVVVWLRYAVVSALVVVMLAVGVGLLGGAGSAEWVAAAVAWVVQAVAFAGLVTVRGDRSRFMMAWAGGMALRLLVIAAAAFWVARGSALDPPTLLLSLVGFVFVLVLLEPLFLRFAD